MLNLKKYIDLLHSSRVRSFGEQAQHLFASQRSLLLPMLILAAGIHAALLAMPIPSIEPLQEAEDKKNPITVKQIPTEKPVEIGTSAAGRVKVPPLTNPPTASDDTTTTNRFSTSSSSTESVGTNGAKADSAPSSSGTGSGSIAKSAPVSSPLVAVSAPKKPTSKPTRVESSSAKNSDSSSSDSTEPSPPSDVDATPEPAAKASPTSTGAIAATPASSSTPSSFADFPHYQPAEIDCYGLGFGKNCRVIENQDMAQVIAYFKKELSMKEFAAKLVIDTVDRKVFKVTKGDETQYLTIWKGKDSISYLLAKVALRSAPEELKTEKPN